MSSLQTKIRQIIYRVRKDYLTLNNVILAVALVLCASWAWASVTTMTRNWELEQKLEARQLNLEKMKLEIATLELSREYYLTYEYQELTARAKLGKMSEGETMVLLPDNSEIAKNKYTEVALVEVAEVSNFESWLSFLFPKN